MNVALQYGILTRAELAALLPVGVAVILQAFVRQFAVYDAGWRGFAIALGNAMLPALTLVAAQIAGVRFSGWRAGLAWGLGFLGYGVVLAQYADRSPRMVDWLLAFGCCALYWGQYLLRGSSFRPLAWKWPFPSLSLDTALILLLSAWVLTMAGVFASSPDPMANMPLRLAVDFAQLEQRPLAFASYLLQFGVLGAVLYAYYWVIRYQLILRLLRRNGVVVFLFGSVAFLALSAPLVATLILQLPLNSPGQSLLPSETSDPFDEDNVRFVFILWLVITPVVLAFERLKSDMLAAQTRHQNIQAELRLLQQQINPHFLFNTLNSLYAMCLQNAPAAADMVAKLANLMRYVVYQGQQPLVALQQELAYLQDYLSLQMLRVGNRCRLSCEWPEAVPHLQLPPLLLIMLVENAFKHGVETSADDCHVHIELTLLSGRLLFLCSNTLNEAAADKWTMQGDGDAGAGVGLENLRRRLQLLYGNRFVLRSEPQQGRWRAELQLELQPC